VLEDITFNIGKHPVNLLLVLQAILTIITTIFIALWVSRVLENKLMRAQHVNMNMRVVLNKVLRVFLLFVAILIALSAVGLDLTLLSVFGGAIGVGLGFGLQRIASNYVCGFIILLDKSMQIGDLITVDKHYGIVNDMRTRYTILDKLDGTHVIIPNEVLVTTAVVNHSLVEHKGRVQINLSVTHNNNLELVMGLMLATAEQQSRVLSMPAPEVQIKGFSLHGIDLALSVWIFNSESGSSALQSALYLAIWRAFEAHGITLAKAEASKLQEV